MLPKKCDCDSESLNTGACMKGFARHCLESAVLEKIN